MMTNRKLTGLILIIVILMMALLSSCGRSVRSTDDPDDPVVPNPPAVTPGMIDSADFPDEEAALMALWYCDQLIPAGEIYAQFRDALKSLRRDFGRSIPEVNIKFRFPAVVGELIIGLNDSAVAEIRNGTYHAWDSLNTLFRLKKIDTSFLSNDFNWVKLVFRGRLHPNYLALYYKNLPGVIYAEANGIIGDSPNIYPWILDGRVTFLARDAWGDCPSGCIESHFFYFKETDSGFELIGDWRFWTPVPDWWEEGRTAFCKYQPHGYCN